MKNELRIKKSLSKALGINLQKADFAFVTDDIKTSVDFTYETSGTNFLFEVDSNNAAKIIFGQYLLLNKSKDIPKNSIFVVIHCYKNYNIDRTKKHLEFAKKAYNCKIPFKIYNENDWNKNISRKSKKEVDKFLMSLVKNK